MQSVTVTATVGDQRSIGHRHPAVTVAHGASRPWHLASAPEGPPDAVEGSQSEMPGLIAFFSYTVNALRWEQYLFVRAEDARSMTRIEYGTSAVRASF